LTESTDFMGKSQTETKAKIWDFSYRPNI